MKDKTPVGPHRRSRALVCGLVGLFVFVLGASAAVAGFALRGGPLGVFMNDDVALIKTIAVIAGAMVGAVGALIAVISLAVGLSSMARAGYHAAGPRVAEAAQLGQSHWQGNIRPRLSQAASQGRERLPGPLDDQPGQRPVAIGIPAPGYRPAHPPTGQTAPAANVPAPPPGWYPDPLGSDEPRFWDGTRWVMEARQGRSQPS